jgi:hypothetical protein
MPFSRMSPVGAARARNASQSHQYHRHRIPDQPMLIMKIGPMPDAMESGIHCVRTHWIRGFMAFHQVRHVRTMMLVVPV